jgi:serine-type D-Ala-D-Ala endopeptidase (penicillin-binding protein 7)
VFLTYFVRSMTLAVSLLMLGGRGNTGTAVASGAPARPTDTITQPARSSPGNAGGISTRGLDLKSHAVLVIDEARGQTLYAKNPENVMPIASITKLMTAMVVLDADLALDETIVIDKADVDGVKHTASRLRVGSSLSRGDLLRLGLMSSENRAAAALGRTYPGGTAALVAAMNEKALELGMLKSHFADATGLDTENVSSAEDLALMVRAASQYPLIREFTTTPVHQVVLSNGGVLDYQNSNGLVKNKRWTIGLSKTGYLNEAGRCLVLKAEIAARPVIIVLLDSWGKYTRLGDANRIKKWMESALPSQPAAL